MRLFLQLDNGGALVCGEGSKKANYPTGFVNYLPSDPTESTCDLSLPGNYDKLSFYNDWIVANSYGVL